ncbi:acetyl-CoA carboxylase biotin carboxyl carrier protein [Jeotgalicoccus halotolerans]|uniref:Biotin carboxyl carrier protein of acetyl-CoA carboxylase n=1 Tax=Jeotgalicoccus halotolerans TaxID=157227 RepID=A0A3E0B153_9STAP|nr:acetyl-CoA carboxylase biotin carboxyl carrier protein [Jeotgalicoccus halotolerans]REG25675.1 acetyl-CoA carboxylase biotin carboxyl carrier protein [Jeotgalicoccus halotolerans]
MNLEQVDSLIEKMERASLTEISYKDKDVDIKLKRELTPEAAPAVQTVQTQSAPPVQSPAKESQPEDEGLVVRAPMVGTFYKAPSPEAEAYVKVGDTVSSTSVVCILEAMKLFNEIQAEVSGEVTEILVDDGDMVEYNQPLFKLR